VDTVSTTEHPCLAPTSVTATNVQLTSATITWTPAEAAQTNFEVRYSTGGDTTALTVEGTSADLTGLHHNTEYSVAVRAICGEGNYSDWSAPATFRTSSCTGVNNVRVSNETVEGATVTWSGNSAAQAYEVAYGLPGVDQNQCDRQRVTATTYTITGLDDATTYVVYVRSECETGIYSDWSEGVTFTTETVGIDDVDSESISLYPNPASSTVTLTGVENGATVTVIDMNGRELYKLQTTNSQLTIDVSQLSQGAYFVRITGERVNAIRKLIVR
jgi:chitodextrinase